MIITWVENMDATLRAMRSDGHSWLAIADEIGVDLSAVRRRARVLGLSPARLNIGPVSGVKVKAGTVRPPRSYPSNPRSPRWDELERANHASI